MADLIRIPSWVQASRRRVIECSKSKLPPLEPEEITGSAIVPAKGLVNRL